MRADAVVLEVPSMQRVSEVAVCFLSLPLSRLVDLCLSKNSSSLHLSACILPKRMFEYFTGSVKFANKKMHFILLHLGISVH